LVVEESRVEDERGNGHEDGLEEELEHELKHEIIERKRRLGAYHFLLLTCIVFGVAAAAFAWTTLRVHDRQVSAETHEKAVAFVLGAPDLRTAGQSTTNGGSVTAFYSAKQHKIAVTGHDLPALKSGLTYEFWYRTGAGATPKAAGTSRFNTPESDMVIVGTGGPVSSLVVTIEPVGETHTAAAPIAELSFS
jgi:hypothetical protein